MKQQSAMESGRVIVLPRGAVDEALGGGISSLWIPIEIGYMPETRAHRVDMANGTKDLVLGFCAAGRGRFEHAKKSREIVAGQAWAALPGIPFSYAADDDDPWSLYWFRGTGARIAWLRNALLGETGDPVFDAGDPFAIATLFNEVMDLLSAGTSKRNLDRAALVFGHLIASIRGNGWEGAGRGDSIDARIDRVVEWIRSHVACEMRVAELAAMCNLSPSYFGLCFRRRTGMSVLEFAVGAKMDKAAKLLHETVLPVKEIAAAVGYADQLYFSRSFKKAFGRPPLAWRERPGEVGKGDNVE